MDFGQPNAEIGQKMANGQLLFLALYYQHACQRFALPHTKWAFRFSILRRPCFLNVTLDNTSVTLIVYFVNYCEITLHY